MNPFPGTGDFGKHCGDREIDKVKLSFIEVNHIINPFPHTTNLQQTTLKTSTQDME